MLWREVIDHLKSQICLLKQVLKFVTLHKDAHSSHTYGQILKKNNNRILFEENGMCLVKMKKLKLNNNALPTISISYGNGHGSMTLAMDSRGYENIVHYDWNIESDALNKNGKNGSFVRLKLRKAVMVETYFL